EAVLAAHERAHPVHGLAGREPEVLVEAEREPRAVDPRAGPFERQVDEVERQLCARRALDRGAGDLAVALRGVTVAGGEERALDGDRQVERRAGDELLAVDVPTLRAR